jgi:hypothetical protein
MDSNHRYPAKFLRLLAIPDQYRRKRSRLAARVAEGFWVRFAPDSPVEGDGFEPSVPGTKEPIFVAEGE